jgi:hypothetical protein
MIAYAPDYGALWTIGIALLLTILVVIFLGGPRPPCNP